MHFLKELNYVLGLSILFVLSGCATVSTPHKPPVDLSILYLQDVCQKHNIHCRWDSTSQAVTINANGRKISALVGSDIVISNKEKIVLSEPLSIYRSAVVVPSDFIKVITMAKTKKAPKTFLPSPQIVREIIIDAGHGGKDPGAIGKSGLYEKIVALDIAKRLKGLLQKEGIKVRMTRSDDTFITLQKRTEIASRSKADLFVSVHANAHPKRGVRGFEVYSLPDLTRRERREEMRRSNEKLMFRHLNMARTNRDVQQIISEMLYEHKQSESDSLATKIANRTSRHIKTRNLGQKEARFYVLRNTLIPSVLVEVGFLSNPKEEKLLKTSGYRQKVATGIARSLMGYINEGGS